MRGNLKGVLQLVAAKRPTLSRFPEMWLTGYSVRDHLVRRGFGPRDDS